MFLYFGFARKFHTLKAKVWTKSESAWESATNEMNFTIEWVRDVRIAKSVIPINKIVASSARCYNEKMFLQHWNLFCCLFRLSLSTSMINLYCIACRVGWTLGDSKSITFTSMCNVQSLWKRSISFEKNGICAASNVHIRRIRIGDQQ